MVLEKVVRQVAPEIILLGQTSAGRDLAPWLAFHLNTGATMDCTALEIDPASQTSFDDPPGLRWKCSGGPGL